MSQRSASWISPRDRAMFASVGLYHLEDHPEEAVLVKSINGSLDRREAKGEAEGEDTDAKPTDDTPDTE